MVNQRKTKSSGGTLVDVNRVKKAVDKLKEINWLYEDVSDDSVDDSTSEHPLDSRQLHLDLMCFPALFPTGAFGENHPREVKIGQERCPVRVLPTVEERVA